VSDLCCREPEPEAGTVGGVGAAEEAVEMERLKLRKNCLVAEVEVEAELELEEGAAAEERTNGCLLSELELVSLVLSAILET
jgi:hypothetical protein